MRTKPKEPYRNGDVALGKSGGHWVADWRDAGSRKRSRLISQARPETDARIALDRFAEARKAVQQQQSSHTIGDLWKLWLAERSKDGLSNKVYEANWVSLSRTFENRTPDLIKPDDCRTYARERFEAGRAQATVYTELTRLRACLKWASETDLIGKPPKIWAPSAGRSRDRVLTPDEAIALVTASRDSDPHIALFVVLAFATGGRHTAILDLTWDRVDFNAGTIELDDDLPPDPMNKSWRKGRATVWMSALARTALLVAIEGRISAYVIEHGGKRLKSVRDGFANAVRRAGLLDDITPHTIRHTVATWADAGDIATGRIAQLLGHRDEATTRKVYTHADAQATKPAVQVIDATFAALPVLPVESGTKVPKKRLKPRHSSRVDKIE